jgi:saccharopine dehydrogenase (NADP+, L-glutamate forming)
VDIHPYGRFEGYANRDSLTYKKLYGIEKIPTLFRGTLRKSGFCSGWNVLVQLGLTDDSIQLDNLGEMSWADLTASFLPVKTGITLEQNLQAELNPDQETMDRLKWLGIFDQNLIPIPQGTPAQALQKLIEEKWKLDDGDKDMIVMWHRFGYALKGTKMEIQSSMVCLGDDQVYTAMAKTVGLPIAIAAKMIMEDKIGLRGVQLPLLPELYMPILDELDTFGITFTENQQLIK